jgi:hypothetical protein
MNDILLSMPIWAVLTAYGIALTAMMAFGGFILVRIGRSPVWVLLLLVPFVQPLAIWYFAYHRWPRIEDPEGWIDRRDNPWKYGGGRS